MTKTFTACPHCGETAPGTVILYCTACREHYCNKCGNGECPICFETEVSEYAGKIEAP